LTTTTRNANGTETTVNSNLAGDVWQLRFGISPRVGFLTRLTRSLTLDAALQYQIINLINRQDDTPKNNLLDPFGRESLITQMNFMIGVMWALPRR